MEPERLLSTAAPVVVVGTVAVMQKRAVVVVEEEEALGARPLLVRPGLWEQWVSPIIVEQVVVVEQVERRQEELVGLVEPRSATPQETQGSLEAMARSGRQQARVVVEEEHRVVIRRRLVPLVRRAVTTEPVEEEEEAHP